MTDIKAGDYVFFGAPTRYSVHWFVLDVNQAERTCKMVSGLSGRIRTGIPLGALSLHPHSLNERMVP